jgi:Peptidase family M28
VDHRGTHGAVRGLIVARIVGLAVLSLLAGCRGAGGDMPAAPEVARAIATVQHLATTIGPRPQGSSAAQRTLEWLESELVAIGAQPERLEVGTVELPAIRVLGVQHRSAHPITVSDPDLVVRFGTSDAKALLIMAHYDTVEGSPGGIDNAAGVAVVLELARELQQSPPPQPVMLVFTAAEEVGLAGAEALAAEYADRVALAISLDLIGGDGELVVNGASELIGAAELRWLADAGDAARVTLDVPAVHRVVSRWWPESERSDHGPFTRRGTRGIHFYNRGHDGEWIDLAYHSARDTAARVEPASIAAIGRLLRTLVATPPPPHAGDGFWLPFVHGLVVPRIALVALEIVLVLIVLGILVFSRVGLLAWLARSRDTVRGPALIAGALCYGAAVGVALGVEKLTSGDHLAPWLHAPGRALIGCVLVIAGGFGLATRIVARIAPWRGDGRYLAIATLVPLAIGLVWFAVGAAELAWVWLVPAAALAVAPLVAGASVPARLAVAIAVVLAALPLPLAQSLGPQREGVWNGFLPVTVPLAGLVGLVGIPAAAAAAWALRRRPTSGPVGTLVLGVGAGLLVISGVVVAVTQPVLCSSLKFVEFLLACERV